MPAYNSNGLGLMGRRRAADEAAELLAGGFAGIKMRLGRPSTRPTSTLCARYARPAPTTSL